VYQQGRGVPQVYPEAVRWYRKAAEQGNAFGQSNLGCMYEQGWGVEHDNAEALRWFRKAADQGNADAQKNFNALQAKIAAAEPPPQPRPRPQPKPQPKDRRLALSEIEEALTGSISPKRVATLVQQLGVSFDLNDEVEKRLRGLGADDKLLIAIAKNHR
jgi:TPR repeat protein